MALITTTLAELGPKLPIGQLRAETFFRDFTVRPWRMREEKALAKSRKDRPNVTMNEYTSTVVAYMCPQLGFHKHEPEDASEKALAERHVYMASMYMCDIWYAYVYVRRDALGDEMVMDVRCPRCGRPFKWTASLSTLEVKYPEKLDDCLWDYELRKPIEVRGKKLESLKLGPQLWSIVDDVMMGGIETTKEAAIRGSIVGVNGTKDHFPLTTGDLDDLTKPDIEHLMSRINDNFVGPNMSVAIEGPCPNEKCKYDEPRNIPINWSYDSFFGVSSL